MSIHIVSYDGELIPWNEEVLEKELERPENMSAVQLVAILNSWAYLFIIDKPQACSGYTLMTEYLPKDSNNPGVTLKETLIDIWNTVHLMIQEEEKYLATH